MIFTVKINLQFREQQFCKFDTTTTLWVVHFSYVKQVVKSSIGDTIPAFSNEWTWFYFTQKCKFPVY